MNTIKYITFFLISAVLLNACTKDFDKINTDPNKPIDAPETNLLAFAIQDFGANVWDSWGDMDEPETYSAHLGKIQYIDESRYQFRTITLENNWTYFYRDLKSLQVVINNAQANGNTNLEAVATTFQSYIWQIATDKWRDLPYLDALAADSGKLTPKYDKQEDIYPAILAKLKSANDLFNKEGEDEIGEGDLLFGSDIQSWQKFCNAIRLRMAIRISKIDPALAKSTIETITGNAAENPIITSNADNAFVDWPGAGSVDVLTSEPWYTSLVLGNRADNYAVGQPLIDTLVKYDDPRLPIYATTAPDDATESIYRGTPIGPAGTTPPGGTSHYSRIGARFAGNETGFTPFLRAAEVQFGIAEAAALGWNVGVTAESAYNKGIELSLEENGADAGDYLKDPNVKWNNDINRIYVQKWIALFKDGHEAWAEVRRTDVPLLPPASGSRYTGHNRPPFRYPYPSSETRLNGTNSGPFVSETEDNYWGKKMWWDTRGSAVK